MRFRSSKHHAEASRPTGAAGWIRGSIAGRGTMSLVALSAIASVGVFGTQAAFTDQVTMAQISVTGGTLDMVANADTDDAAVAWTGSLSVALTGLVPGSENSGTVAIDNVGDLPYTLTASTTGADAANCFSYYFRETSAVGATRAASWPVAFTGMGTAVGSDATTAPFATAITNRQLPDNGADNNWEADDTKTYTITVRMNAACTTNAANGTLDFTFNAAQV